MRDVDKVIESVRAMHPTVTVEQLKVRHPGADDDGLWFFTQPETQFQVQIESSTGMCPFLIEAEATDVRYTTNSVEETVETLSALLDLAKTKTSAN